MNCARTERPATAIRAATIRDVPLIVALIDAGHGEQWSGAIVTQLLATQGGWGLIAARSARRPAGVLLARTTVDEAEIINLLVLPRDRRRGIGGALMRAAILQSRRQRVSSLFLEVGVDNAPARALYANLGFEEIGRRPDYYTRDVDIRVDALIMRKQLITLPNE